ncbi:hypothetical protein VTL71DRAFT_8472 [Oculimacula yallundae]|uniref:Uncharacterized protein n=1 Tax=Oculimacula yallundae TaxID=86028 RepID=A0ABR4CZ74_9HELO
MSNTTNTEPGVSASISSSWADQVNDSTVTNTTPQAPETPRASAGKPKWKPFTDFDLLKVVPVRAAPGKNPWTASSAPAPATPAGSRASNTPCTSAATKPKTGKRSSQKQRAPGGERSPTAKAQATPTAKQIVDTVELTKQSAGTVQTPPQSEAQPQFLETARETEEENQRKALRDLFFATEVAPRISARVSAQLTRTVLTSSFTLSAEAAPFVPSASVPVGSPAVVSSSFSLSARATPFVHREAVSTLSAEVETFVPWGLSAQMPALLLRRQRVSEMLEKLEELMWESGRETDEQGHFFRPSGDVYESY